MKRDSLLLIVWLLAMMIAGGCKPGRTQVSQPGQSGQRLIKVSFRGQSGSFRIRINRSTVEKLSCAQFTNVVWQLRLDYGDIVVWEAERNKGGKEQSWPDDISSWWSRYLADARVSYYGINSDSVDDFFAVPIYHWKAPAEKPRHLADASFYVDGIVLGADSVGFRTMVDSIQESKSGPVFILAPRIRNEGSASPWIAGEQLRDWAEIAAVGEQFDRIFFGRYGELTDWARLMDD